MNPLQEKLQKLLAEADVLEKKADRTAEETAAWVAKLDEAEAVAKDLANADRAAALRSRVATVQEPVQITGLTEKAGTTTIDAATGAVIDSDGWDLTEKQFRAISEPTYKRSWLRYCAGKADTADLKAMQEGLDQGGGYLVPADIVNEIVMRKPHPTNVLSAISVTPTTSDRYVATRLNYTTDDIYPSGVRISWVGEAGTVAEDTSLDNAWGQIEIPVYDGGFQIELSRSLMEDSPMAIESDIRLLAGQTYDLGLDSVITGTGGNANVPQGMRFNAGGTGGIPTFNVGNPATADNLITFTYGLPPQYAANASWLMNRTSVYASLATLKDSANAYIGFVENRDATGLATARGNTFLGQSVAFSAFMPNTGSANQIAVYGDLRQAYKWVQRLGLSAEVYGLQDREMLRAQRIGLNFRFRAGGGVWQPRAARIAVQS